MSLIIYIQAQKDKVESINFDELVDQYRKDLILPLEWWVIQKMPWILQKSIHKVYRTIKSFKGKLRCPMDLSDNCKHLFGPVEKERV